MSKAIIGVPSWREGATVAGGAWAAGDYELANLLTDDISEVARSANLGEASTAFNFVLGADQLVRSIAFVNHNAENEDTFQITLWGDEAKSDQVYQGAAELFWPEVYGLDDVGFEGEAFWTGQYAARERQGAIATRPVWLPAWYLTKVVSVQIRAAENSAGYFQIGAVDVAEGHQFNVNFGWGSRYGYRFRTREAQAWGGEKRFQRLPKPRVFQGSIERAWRNDGQATFLENLRQNDLDRPFLWHPRPDEPRHWLRNSFWARNVDPGLFAYASADGRREVTGGRDTVPLAFEEAM